MPLKMKGRCQRCRGDLPPDGEAYICSYECTFCRACTDALSAKCPNCEGELLRRPRRTTPVVTVVARGLARRLGNLLGGSS